MKSGNLLLGLVACAALCACTDNDIAESGGGNNSQVFSGDVAYMVVNIKEVGTAATKASAGSFSTGMENAVKDVNFYFYDKDGNFVTVSTPDWTDGDSGTDGNNVELTGKKVVVLHGLSEKVYPSYMVTILNQPSGFTTPQTLDAMKAALVDASDVCGTTYFTMSTSSYLDNDNNSNHDTYYFATPVTEDKFSTEPYDETTIESLENAVSVYVERLAAKVQLKNGIEGGKKGSDNLPWENYVGGNPESTPMVLPGGMSADNLPMTRDIGIIQGGTGNAPVDSTYYMITLPIYGVTDDGTIESESTDLYIHLDKWGLNATAKQSYMMKHIDSTWDTTNWTGWDTDLDWNDATNHRSYWGMSWNYNNSGCSYPESSSDITETTDYCLDYIKASDLPNYLDGRMDYCAENTNTAGSEGVITSKNSPAITSILVLATVYGPDGNPLDLVKNDTEFYTKNGYLTLALQAITGLIYVGDNGSYSPIDISYLDLTGTSDGKVKVCLGSDYSSVTFYSDDAGTESIDDVDELLDDHFNTYYMNAVGYTEGQMYYNVPIEHLNNDYENGIQEANYGVVRNHYYVVTLTEITGLGRGITDTDDPIVPQEDDEYYYCGAEVQILSWKEVDQSATLD